MNLQKAIEILKEQSIEASNYGLLERVNANELGVEALKRHKWNEDRVCLGVVKPLPGETLD